MEQPPGYVVRGGQKIVVSISYMDSIRVQGCDLRSSALLFLVLSSTGIIQITLSSSNAQSLTS